MESANPFEWQFFTRRNAILFLASGCIVMGFGGAVRPMFAIGIFLSALLLIEMIVCALAASRLSADREHYPRTFEGQEVEMTLEVANRSIWTASLVQATDNFPPGPYSRIAQMATVLPGKRAQRFMSRQPCVRRRGLYLLGPVTLETTSPLGLISISDTADEITRLLVYPSIEPVPGFNVLSGGTHSNIGSEIVNALGRSAEFRGIRKYRFGDPPNWIHWRSTAKHRALHVKEFDRNVSTEVTIICDLFLVSQSGLGDFTSVESRLRVAGSIAHEAIRKHHAVRVVAAKQPRQATRLAGGASHLTAILDWMSLLRAEGQGSFEEFLTQESQLLRRGSTAVLVLSSIHTEAALLLEAIAALQQRSIYVIAAVVDDRTFVKLRLEQEEYYRAALPLTELIGLLKSRNVPSYSIGSQDDIRRQLGAA